MKKVLKWMMAVFMITLAGGRLYAGFEGRPVTEGLLSPTAHTLNKGEFMVGLGPVSYGITDQIQVGTNILMFFLGPNFNGKLNLIPGLAVGAGYWKMDIGDLADVSALTLFIPFTTQINDKWKLHLTGQYASINVEVGDEDLTGSISGTSLSLGIEGDMGKRAKFLVEGGYDIDFETTRFGAGLLFGWKTFRLKLGAILHPVTWPVIGLWWRFEG